eukprot:1842768-Alexandrium_andersonii.AAC.1
MCIRDRFPRSNRVVDLVQGKGFVPYSKPLKIMARELPAQMIRALQDEQGPPPGLEPPDCRPGPHPKPDSKDDPDSDIELGFVQP